MVRLLRYHIIQGGADDRHRTSFLQSVGDRGGISHLEVPYALPPGRFEDPEPLPSDFRYEEKEYIVESKCEYSHWHDEHFSV